MEIEEDLGKTNCVWEEDREREGEAKRGRERGMEGECVWERKSVCVSNKQALKDLRHEMKIGF